MNPIMDNIILPSSPSSSSSSNASSPIMIRGDGLPPYGSNAMCASVRLPSDNELRYEGIEKLIQRLRNCEMEHKKLLMERGRVMKDVNRRLQVHLVEVRGLKDMNQKLMLEKDRLIVEKERLAVEKDELAGMCCFLDDDRDKAKKMAREWQVFGRYATGVLQKELSQCNVKIRELEQRQQTLLLENKNLKELCLLLDQEQAGSRTSIDSQSSLHGPASCPSLLGVAGTRDSGDGSSNGSTASNCSPDHRLSSTSFQKDNNSAEGRENYVRFLENKVRHLEDEVKGRLKKVTSTVPTQPQGIFNMSPNKHPVDRRIFPSSMHHHSSSNSSPSSSVLSHNLSNSSSSVNNASGGNTLTSPVGRISGSETSSISSAQSSSSQTPEAIAYAMKQVLELHDQLDNNLPNSMYPGAPGDGNHLDEQHKEIVREMCNVVWRKLGDSRSGNTKPPPQSRTLQHRTASVSNL